MLRWAVQNTHIGRDNAGWRLAARLRELGLDQDELEAMMEQYQRAVCVLDTPGNPYTLADCRGTAKRAMRKVAPEAIEAAEAPTVGGEWVYCGDGDVRLVVAGGER
jgi:hypothetical protein